MSTLTKRNLVAAVAVAALVGDSALVLGETLLEPIAQAKGLKSKDRTSCMNSL